MTKDLPDDADGRKRREKTVACSPRCHKRVQRERAGHRKEDQPCRYCGEPVWDYSGRDYRCPEDDRTDHCDELQYLAEARAGYVADRRTQRTAVCVADGCDQEVTWSGKGRVKTICSARCRQRVRRARQRQEATQ
ncbi:hypothetical protein OG746_29320 [Streptomyces sp. NBC_01016]|uniref:hypothetical protein n=1 Tax=Streptomyces sp. NBC_01016 TaxID=2903720 RepID=UPI002255E0B5|nr:hypothetical protein [Streptomyces sp. NBC_01016]MCX4832839.1 hypothetical protein [Streptomyces sp. NBC_01016]